MTGTGAPGGTTEHRTTSADGTVVGYTRRGAGPGVVLVQGATGTAEDYEELASALAAEFTVLVPDRRGRGRTPRAFEEGHDIARDVEDLDAVLSENGADRVFGLSSGAVIALDAARTLPRVTRAALYEPPFYADGISRSGIARLKAAIGRGDLASALILSLRTAGTAPAPIRLLPMPLARLLAAAVLAVDGRRSAPGRRLRDLLPGIRYDFADVSAVDGRMAEFASVRMPVLLVSGTRSPEFLRRAVRDLAGVLPNARIVELDGLGHDGPWNRSRGGRPDLVADALRTFLR